MKRLLQSIILLFVLSNLLFAGRYYDAATGRFLQVDPHATKYPSLSSYSYVANNPLKYIDPDGRDYTVSEVAQNNSNFQSAWQIWTSTKIGSNNLSTIAENSKIMVYFDIGQSEYMEGVTNHQDPVNVKIAKKTGGFLVTGMNNKVTVKQTKAKDGQLIIIVTINENKSGAEGSKTLNHEVEAHIILDPDGTQSQEVDHKKYSGTNPDGSAKDDANPTPGTPADRYNKEIDEMDEEQK